MRQNPKIVSLGVAENPGSPGRYVAYHASTRRFDKPDFGKLRRLDFGPGFYFAVNRDDAAGYGSVVYRAEVELKNPIIISFDQIDDALVKKLQRALQIDEDTMAFGREEGAHPISYIFEMARTLVEVGTLSPHGLRNYLVKIGYDGAIIDPEVVNDSRRRAGSSRGDVAHDYYIAVFSPEQILSWEMNTLGDAERERNGRRSAQNPRVDKQNVASNGPQLHRTRRIFDECFDVVEERFPDFGECELHHDERASADNGTGSERQFGYCMDGDPLVIAFAAKIEGMPDEYIRGLMRHEFGHAIDFRYGKDLGKMLGRRLPDGIERRADVIAECVFGDPIEYGHLDIQCIGCGGKTPRPGRLAK